MTEAPKPLFVVIGVIALAFIASTAYVALEASTETSTIPGATVAHAPTEAPKPGG